MFRVLLLKDGLNRKNVGKTSDAVHRIMKLLLYLKMNLFKDLLNLEVDSYYVVVIN